MIDFTGVEKMKRRIGNFFLVALLASPWVANSVAQVAPAVNESAGLTAFRNRLDMAIAARIHPEDMARLVATSMRENPAEGILYLQEAIRKAPTAAPQITLAALAIPSFAQSNRIMGAAIGAILSAPRSEVEFRMPRKEASNAELAVKIVSSAALASPKNWQKHVEDAVAASILTKPDDAPFVAGALVKNLLTTTGSGGAAFDSAAVIQAAIVGAVGVDPSKIEGDPRVADRVRGWVVSDVSRAAMYTIAQKSESYSRLGMVEQENMVYSAGREVADIARKAILHKFGDESQEAREFLPVITASTQRPKDAAGSRSATENEAEEKDNLEKASSDKATTAKKTSTDTARVKATSAGPAPDGPAALPPLPPLPLPPLLAPPASPVSRS